MAGPTRARCAVIVVNFNGADFLGECLESLLQQRTSGLELDIVVVDNNSTDGSQALMQESFAGVRLILSDRNLGFAGGVNLGIAATAGEFVVLVNNDAVAEPGFLEAVTAPFHRPGAERLAAVTGRILLAGRFAPASGAGQAYRAVSGQRWVRLPAGVDVPGSTAPTSGVSLINSTGSQLSRSGNARDRDWLMPAAGERAIAEADSRDDEADAKAGASAEAATDVFGFCGGAVALRRSALEDVGGFDDRLFLYYEDVDLSWRLRRGGWQIRYAADAVVTHRHAASSGIGTRLFLVHNIRNRVLVTARNGPPEMVLRATSRTLVSWLKAVGRSPAPGGQAARRQALAGTLALGQLARMLPAFWADGRRLDRTAPLPRAFVDRWLLPD